MACISPTLARPGAVLTSASRRGDRRGGRSRGAARPRGEARFLGAVVAAGKASDDASQQQVGEKGYVAGEGVLSMDKLMEVPIRRFKPTSEECPFCRDAPVKENGSKCLGICRNPQNVPGPLVHPHQMQDVEDAVRLQINAMKENNEPRNHHGVQVLWEYSVESGNMERSRYFGISSDMYHYDHFIGKALKFFGPLVRNQGVAAFRGTSVMEDGRTMVKVEVTDIVGEPTYWAFIMVKRTFGKYEGCWQSHRILQTDENFDSKYLEFC